MTKADHFFKRATTGDRKLCGVCGRRSGAHPSKLEAAFDAAVVAAGLQDGMTREHAFAEEALGRGWRFDRAWPRLRIAVELDGGSFMAQGRHSTQRDLSKDNAARILGWVLLTFDMRLVKTGVAVAQLAQAILVQSATATERERARASLSREAFPTAAELKTLQGRVRAA